MRRAERGFLLLSSHLGNPDRRPLTTAQLRTLADRSWKLDSQEPDRQMERRDLMALGYNPAMADRILELLSQEELLDVYLQTARQYGCYPITRVSDQYPLIVRKRLGLDSPGVLWAKGDFTVLNSSMVALIGSRDILPENREFAAEAGRQAALQGYTLVSGNARGADRTAQEACLAAGGRVVVVVADVLADHQEQEGVLYLSEEDFDLGFSAQRALSRNRIIHCLADLVLVAQCGLGTGGTWDGTTRNLRWGWSPVCCFRDGSESTRQLWEMGAQMVNVAQLSHLKQLHIPQLSFFDQ